MADQRMEKWTRWLDEIHADVGHAFTRRHAWRTVAGMIDTNPKLPPSYWWPFMRETYLTTQAMFVRRQTDTVEQSGSLAKLLTELVGDSERFTRAEWLARETENQPPIAALVLNAQWDEHYGGLDHFDPAIAQRDLDALNDQGDVVRAYVDKHVAHFDANAPADIELTFPEVDHGIDLIGSAFPKYKQLIVGVYPTDLVEPLDEIWLGAFDMPWNPNAPK